MGIRSRDQGAFASQGGVEVPAGRYPQEGVKRERRLESEKSCLIHPPSRLVRAPLPQLRDTEGGPAVDTEKLLRVSWDGDTHGQSGSGIREPSFSTRVCRGEASLSIS